MTWMSYDKAGDYALAYIKKTCPLNVYPLKPHFYIEKNGV